MPVNHILQASLLGNYGIWAWELAIHIPSIGLRSSHILSINPIVHLFFIDTLLRPPAFASLEPRWTTTLIFFPTFKIFCYFSSSYLFFCCIIVSQLNRRRWEQAFKLQLPIFFVSIPGSDNNFWTTSTQTSNFIFQYQFRLKFVFDQQFQVQISYLKFEFKMPSSTVVSSSHLWFIEHLLV